MASEKFDRPLIQNGTLDVFMKSYLDTWEPGHEAGLREATAEKANLNPTELAEFERGFRATMSTMDACWHGLTDSLTKKIYLEPSWDYLLGSTQALCFTTLANLLNVIAVLSAIYLASSLPWL